MRTGGIFHTPWDRPQIEGTGVSGIAKVPKRRSCRSGIRTQDHRVASPSQGSNPLGHSRPLGHRPLDTIPVNVIIGKLHLYFELNNDNYNNLTGTRLGEIISVSDLYEIYDNNFNYYHYQPG